MSTRNRNHAPIVVTGAASGIGAALATILREQGREVIGLDRVAGDGILSCDLADPDSIAAAVEQLPAELGGLANVAGVPGTAPAATVLQVNVLGPRLLSQAVESRLVADSAIVSVASVAAHNNTQPEEALEELHRAATHADIAAWLASHPIDGTAAYDTSKRVVVDWTVRTAAALIGTGVRALSVSPGPVQTPILDDFAATMGQDRMARSVATVGRHGRPEEIAAVVAFCLSPDASWLNGIDILVEGGLMAARTAAQVRDRLESQQAPTGGASS
ncbi:SDR family oxidoreductase [Nocardioides sp. AE5]|uniref:SDR family oxidoreductase n=1 Tax=Nocardioides sp. AE5 TaxID=2962573 RepID=UPI0028816743|nr:SDR family oxidoreductase [Nocardioides sp. AE5]MDT0201660.1 SDR family oxidoreductase [Nocardioides sp. AE5]